jgi:probable HAF family extracellular repeat protein
MQTRQLSFFLSLLLTLCLFHDTQAQQAGRIESMKLLTPNVGWAATKQKLFWTTDGGAQWKDITPKLDHEEQQVSSVFFLDQSAGWALMHCGDNLFPPADPSALKSDRDLRRDDTCFEFASTSDTGASWSIMHPKIVDPSQHPEDGSGFSLGTFLKFVDREHGWAILKRGTNTMFSSGVMLRTADGGRTWAQLKNVLPLAEEFRFTDPKDGWIAGGPEHDLYVTHDGGDSWQKVESLPDMGDSLPVFENERQGLMPVGNILLGTDNGGKTWKQSRALTGIPENSVLVIVNSFVIAIHSDLKEERINDNPNGSDYWVTRTKLSLYVLGPDGKVSSDTAEIPVPTAGGTTQLSFFDRDHGWIALSGRLFATKDTGKSWGEITPGGAPPLQKRIPAPAHAKASPGSIPLGNAASTKLASGNVSTNLGFDTQYVPCAHATTKTNPCTTAQSLSFMQAWMSSSPYYDVGVYLPGAPNRGTDPALNSTWVQGTVQQGWGIIPIWVGLQAPCVIQTGLSHFGPTAAEASNQGAEEADQAVAAAQTLGLSTTIIYKDIENYNPSGSCSPVVQAFVDAWDTEIHVHSGYATGAGVYANYIPINQDIATVSVIPDDIWITRTSSPPKATIWNLGVPDKNWPNNQRMHQFLIDQPNVQFGGTTLLSGKLDDDIVNATIANANAVAKSYSYGESNIDCTNLGALSTSPLAINNMSGGVLINGPGQVGTIVGYFADANTDHGFQNSAGVCSSIDVPGAVATLVTGINNLGQVVGWWYDGSTRHGFFQKPGAAPVTVDYQGAIGGTQLLGVNDAGQIIGAAALSGLQSQAFLYYGSTFYPIGTSSDPGYLIANGINGDATVAGNFPNNFEDSLLPPSWSGTPILISPAPVAAVNAIDSNDDVVGYGYESAACANSSEFCGFLWIGNAALTVLTWPNSSFSYPYAINDFGQIVGEYVDLAGLQHGGLWVPQ